MAKVNGYQFNGIDINALQQTIRAIQENPTLAQFNFRALNRWVDGTHNRAMVKDFYEGGQKDESRTETLVYEEDEPPVLLGNNKGGNPVEYILVGLSGCLTTALVAQAAARGVKLKSVKSQLEGDLDIRGFLGLDDTIRNGYQQIRVNFNIESDEPEETIRELVDMAQKRSPVFDIVTHQVPVTVDFTKK